MLLYKKSPLLYQQRALIKIWQLLTLPPVKAVPSAQVGLTSLFGKGRGGPHRYNHHKILTEALRGKD